MKTIYKYKLTPTHEVKIPRDRTLLCASMQGACLTLWAMVDTNSRMTPFDWWVLGTGEDAGKLPRGAKFLQTVFDGPYVWHIFVGPDEKVMR